MKKNELKKVSLIDLTRSALEIQGKIEEAEGDITGALELEYNGNLEQFQDKAITTAYVSERLEYEAEDIDKKIKELQARKKALLNNSARVKQYLLNCMSAAGIEKITSDLYRINTQLGGAHAVIEDEDLVHWIYKKCTVTIKLPASNIEALEMVLSSCISKDAYTVKTTIDKAAVTKALKEGKKVKGAYLPEQPLQIRIKS